MAELTTPAETTASSCCAPEARATCCDPSAEAECCDPSRGEGCGCTVATTQAGDIREQVRERVEARVLALASEGRIEESAAMPGRWMIA
jgi:hypothetical protein